MGGGMGAEELEAGGLRYATTFRESILGVSCDIDVTANLKTGKGTTVVSMRRTLSPNPGFQISGEDLVTLLSCIKMAKAGASLLVEKPEMALDHQLNCSCGGAMLVVVKPLGKPARFALNIGLFHREGDLEDLSVEQLEVAITTLDRLKTKVLRKAKKWRDSAGRNDIAIESTLDRTPALSAAKARRVE
jgi:hypothetical protein